MAPSSYLTTLVARAAVSGDGSSTTITPTVVGGIVVACVAAAVVLIWAGVRFFRKRSISRREKKRNSAFLVIRGVVKEGEVEKPVANESSRAPALPVKGQFSRNQLNGNIVLPAKTLAPNASRDEIIEHYTAEGSLPRPFAPFMTGGGGAPGSQDNQPIPALPTITAATGHSRSSSVQSGHSRMMSTSFLSAARGSIMSMGSSHNRFSVASVATTDSSIGSGHVSQRKVRQLFNPVLPDELVISMGESLTVVTSYEDGWCIVGRDGFGGTTELGAVPAWCFIKSAPGLRAERPMRTASLGVTININEDGGGPRSEVMSWSNF
ncbi:hypothetical protein EUX98_g6818 [Antrodiella citrinella]|uniref:SH3 domain-containing protein n=1 Tax=Antrodiella citrinella TaxID=2447956 RepID=A0A4S4MN27_9APHY|nr:hypothetical protein EUX98_g6818 [Antrodiella citrinella]